MTAAPSVITTILSVCELHEQPGHNPRKVFSSKSMAELKDSVAKHGVLQAILVRPREEGGYWIVAGHSRVMAAREAGLAEIPAVVRQMSDNEALMAAIVENATRSDVSPIDEGAAAARLLAQVGGDKSEVMRLLGWSRTMLDSRILLTHAVPEVAQALMDGVIVLGHAELLAGLRASAQASGLKRVIDEKLSVKELKERLEKAAQRLSHAIFDTTECNGCQHNSDTQATLFSTSLDASRCLNPACFQQKTSSKLDEIKTDASESHANVVFDSDVPAGSFVLLDAAEVGDEQVKACQMCENLGAIISTKIGEAGLVLTQRCLNVSCNTEKKQAEKKRKAALIVTDKAPRVETHASKAGVATVKAEAPKAEKPSQAVVDQHHKVHRATAKSVVAENRTVMLATVVLAVAADGKLPQELAGFSYVNRTEAFESLVNKTEDELLALLTEIAATTMVYSKDTYNSGEPGRDTFGALAMSLAKRGDLSRHFTVDAAYLDILTKGGIESLLEESGFAAAFKQAKSEKEYKSLVASKKTELIEKLMAFGYDFNGYIPTQMRLK